MNNKLLGIVMVAILLTLASLLIVASRETQIAGATVDDIWQGSNSTSTYYASVSSQATGGCILLKGATSTFAGPATGRMPGVLEDLVFTGFKTAGASFIGFYDATTSNANLRTGTPATTSITLAEIYGGESASTTQKEFNFGFKTGLLMCASGSLSSSTVTWK